MGQEGVFDLVREWERVLVKLDSGTGKTRAVGHSGQSSSLIETFWPGRT